MMDPKSQETLAEIVAKEPVALTEADIAFLRARRSYLSEEQRAVFADVLTSAEDKQDEDLSSLSDRKLNKLAKDLELDPKDFENKDELIAAIKEKQAENEN